MTGRHDTVGADLVNHCVNDILVQGAEPLFFLDYLATGRLSPAVAEQVVAGVARALPRERLRADRRRDRGDAGLLRRRRIRHRRLHRRRRRRGAKSIDGRAIVPGDVLIGLPSAGLHTNGYSLARRVLFEIGRLDSPTRSSPSWARPSATRCSRRIARICTLVRPLLERDLVKGLAHITGGGITENLPRMLPEGCAAEIDLQSWTVPPLFRLLQQHGAHRARRDVPRVQHGRRPDHRLRRARCGARDQHADAAAASRTRSGSASSSPASGRSATSDASCSRRGSAS